MTKQTNLIIGCGYLGRRVADLWLRQGRRVLATTRDACRAEEFRRRGLEPIICNVVDRFSLQNLPAVHTVVYCIGFDRAAGHSMREVYVGGLSNVLDHLPRPERFIHISSTSVYGQADGSWVDETSATEAREESGRIVLEAERLLRTRIPEAVVLRFAGIYGPHRLMRLQALRGGQPIVGDGDRWLNLIHVDDGAAMVLAAEENADAGGVYNICDDQPIPRRVFYAEIARLVGAPPPRFVPPPAGSPPPAHDSSNRRVCNRLMHEKLHVELQFPSYIEGLPSALAD